jgi:tetratricopeptide (TPR) repeat protein
MIAGHVVYSTGGSERVTAALCCGNSRLWLCQIGLYRRARITVNMSDPSPEQQPMTIQQALDLAVQHHNEGRLPEAEKLYNQILQADPKQPIALHLLGVIAYQVGKNDVAVDLISKALDVMPDYVEAYNNLGNAFNGMGKLEEAVASYRKALAIKPDYAEAHNNLGSTLDDLGKPDEAISHYRNAISIKPDYAEAHHNVALALEGLRRWDDAATSYQRALAIKPDYAEAHFNLGNVLKEQDRLDEAIASYRKALAIKADYVEAHNNLGVIFQGVNELKEAVACYNRALAIQPDYAEAHNNYGNTLKELGRLDEAVTRYRQALAIKPDHAEAHVNLSYALQLQGNLKEGWEEYEWRSKTKTIGTRLLPIEMWSGSPLQGKSILVYAEQGVGDEITFASCIPDLVEQSPTNLYLECSPRLEALFARSFPGVHVSGTKKDTELSWMGEIGQPNYALPIGSLPKFFRNSVAEFPERQAYLTANPDLVEKWTKRLAGLNEGPRIGISWKGGSNPSIARKASIHLPEWLPLFSSNASFINLQYGDVSEEIAALGDVLIHDWPDNDPLKDLDNQAALISCLDLVITIDNATVHMAGALGAKTWALVEQLPDWRWPEAFGDCPPLYRSVRLFRQKRLFEWGAVMYRVAQALDDLIANHS